MRRTAWRTWYDRRGWVLAAIVLFVATFAAVLVVSKMLDGAATTSATGTTTVTIRHPGDAGDPVPAELVGTADCRQARRQLDKGPPHFVSPEDSLYGLAIGHDHDLVENTIADLETGRINHGRVRPYAKALRSIRQAIGYYAPARHIPRAFRVMHNVYYKAIVSYQLALEQYIRARAVGRPGTKQLAAIETAEARLISAGKALDYCTGGQYLSMTAELDGTEDQFPEGIKPYGPMYPLGSPDHKRHPFAGIAYELYSALGGK